MIQHEYNRPLSNPNIAPETGDLIFEMVDSVNFKIAGMIYGPTPAGQDLPSLVGVNIDESKKVGVALLGKVTPAGVVYSIEQSEAYDSAEPFVYSNLYTPKRDEVLLGYAIIETNSSTQFVGGTTVLGDAGIVVTVINNFGQLGQ